VTHSPGSSVLFFPFPPCKFYGIYSVLLLSSFTWISLLVSLYVFSHFFPSVALSPPPHAFHSSVSFFVTLFSYLGHKIIHRFRDWHVRMCVFSTHGLEISSHWVFYFFTNYPTIIGNIIYFTKACHFP